jgi:hypothetical protein
MCGKPQREEDIPKPEPVTVAAALPPPPAPPALVPVSFHNRLAVRTAMMTASLATVLCSFFFLLSPIWLPAAGFGAVYFYRRRTGQPLTPGAGARMGWITGTFVFGIAAVLTTIQVFTLVNSENGMAAIQQQMRSMPMYDAAATAQALKMMQSPAVLIMGVIFMLCFLFAIIMSFCAAGGALGAKLLQRD